MFSNFKIVLWALKHGFQIWKPLEALGSLLEAFGSPNRFFFINYIENHFYITSIIYYVLSINKIQGLVRRLGMMTAVGGSVGYHGFGVGYLAI